MELVFLGTGGGRVNLIKQVRGTAGFRVHGSLNIHVDPGPGALQACKQFGVDPLKTDVVFVSHAHVDHSNDANLLVEAMTQYTFRKRGTLLATRNVLQGSERFDRVVSSYHASKPERVELVAPDAVVVVGSAVFTFTKTRHDEPGCAGFVLATDGKKLGYTSDTEFFPGLAEQFKDCDLLIVNNLKPAMDAYKGHLCTADTIEILKEAKPKLAVISHLGMSYLQKPAEMEAEFISEKSGVRTIAARDGMCIDVQTLAVLNSKHKTKAGQNLSTLTQFE